MHQRTSSGARISPKWILIPLCRVRPVIRGRVCTHPRQSTLPVCPLLPLIPSAQPPPSSQRHGHSFARTKYWRRSKYTVAQCREASTRVCKWAHGRGAVFGRKHSFTCIHSRVCARRERKREDRRIESERVSVSTRSCACVSWLQQRRAIIPWSWRRTRWRKAVTEVVVSGKARGEERERERERKHKECSIPCVRH